MLHNTNLATTGTRLYNVTGEENGEIYAVCSSKDNARQVIAILKGNGLKDKLNVEDTGMYLDEIKIGNNRMDVNAETMTMRKLFANFANDYQVVHVTHPFVGERQVQKTRCTIKEMLKYHTELIDLPISSWKISVTNVLVVEI